MPVKFNFRFAAILFLSCCIQLNAYSQKNFKPGYIVYSTNDTIYGFIDYRNWMKMPKKIQFKKTMESEPTELAANAITTFSVEGEIYRGAIINAQEYSDIIDELSFVKDVITTKDTTFLLTIINGPKSLFKYINKQGYAQFYIYQDSAFQLLEYKRYRKSSSEVSVVLKNNKYYPQLAVYLKDCPTIQKKIINLKYQQKGLEKIFKYYYGCTNKPIEYEKKQEKVLSTFGAIAGLTLNNLSYSPSLSYSRIPVEFKTTPNFTVGLFSNIALTRNQQKWSIYNELAISPFKVEFNHFDYKSENEHTNYELTFKYTYLKLNTMLRYKYGIGKVFVFINVGISNGYAISETNQAVKNAKFYSSETSKTTQILNPTRLYEQGLVGGLGVQYGKFSFESRYERGNGNSKMLNLNSITNRGLFIFGYRF